MPATVPDANPPRPSASSHSSASRAGHSAMHRCAGRSLGTKLTSCLHPAFESEVLDESHDERRPTGLVAGTEAAAGVPIEVLIEQYVISPQRIVRPTWVVTAEGAASVLVRQKQRRNTPR